MPSFALILLDDSDEERITERNALYEGYGFAPLPRPTICASSCPQGQCAA
jgi:hypothetical protein